MRAGVGRRDDGGDATAACLSEDQVIAVLAGELAPVVFAAAEDHFDACRLCRLLVSTLAARTNDGVARRQLSAFGPGDLVADRYEISALLGVGGMGEVYAALDRVLGERIALKCIAPGGAFGDRAISRLKAEVQIARRVTHRNVCRVFDVGFHVEPGKDRLADESTSIPFLTMELLAGETLRSHLRRREPLPLAEVREILSQMAAGLDAAHAAGVIHRDLKSENVMLVRDQDGTRVVISDFGLARAFPASNLVSLQSGGHRMVAGTFGYMAPEQLSGRPTSPATDVYALGVVAFELLTGDLPFSPPDIVTGGADVLRTEPPSLATREDIPSGWEVAIRRCLEADPAARFQSARDLAAALRSRPVGSRAWRPVVRVTAVVATVVAVTLAALLLPVHVARGGRPAPALNQPGCAKH